MTRPNNASDVWKSRSHPLQEDMLFQRWTWSVQRVGWAAMVLVAGLALAGLFSNGPLSSSTAVGGRLEVDYEQILMNGAPTTVWLRVAADDEQATILIDAPFLRSFRIETATPAPLEERGGTDGVSMTFAADGPLHVRLDVRPDAIGRVESEISLVGEAPARLRHWVYP